MSTKRELMSTQSMVHDAVTKIESNFSNEPMLAILSTRVLGLIAESFEQLKGNTKDTEQLVALTDEKLMSTVAIMLSKKRAMVNERELRKQERRLEAKQGFFQMLEKHGGLYKAGDVAKILGVSRQTVNNQRARGKLINIIDGNDYLFPAFQFTENAKLSNIEIILNELKELSPITQCSFFINQIDNSEELITPIDLLKRGANDQELALLKREAAIFGTSMTN